MLAESASALTLSTDIDSIFVISVASSPTMLPFTFIFPVNVELPLTINEPEVLVPEPPASGKPIEGLFVIPGRTIT